MTNYFGKLITCPVIILIMYPIKTADIMIKKNYQSTINEQFSIFHFNFFHFYHVIPVMYVSSVLGNEYTAI